MTLWPDEVNEMIATAKALGDRLERIVGALDAMGAEAELVGWSAWDPCDCGHRRNVHRNPRHGSSACLVDGCGCVEWDDTHLRADAWRERELEKARTAERDELAAKRADKGAA